MTRKERASKIHQILESEFTEVPIPLDHKDPYTLLVAVLLSAQCTDERVNKITPLLFSKADNPYDMVKMSVEAEKSGDFLHYSVFGSSISSTVERKAFSMVFSNLAGISFSTCLSTAAG